MQTAKSQSAKMIIDRHAEQVRQLVRLVKNDDKGPIEGTKNASELLGKYHSMNDMIAIYNMAFDEALTMSDYGLEDALRVLKAR